jgi:CRISPR/Cas system-associated exonuclease Cas4 (RecB family)
LHYIGLWNLDDIGQQINQPVNVRGDLRGYAMQPLPPDRRPQTLSVSDLALTRCSTNRDIYFAKVERRRRSGNRPWQAEAGVLIHTLLQEIHRYARRSLPTRAADFNPESLFRRLKTFGTRTKNRLLSRYRNDNRFAGRIWTDLNNHLDNIIFFETLVISSLLTYKGSRKTVLSSGASFDPTQEFDQLFDFSAIEHSIAAVSLGLTEPVTPDFLFAHRVIGDIKTGDVHEETFEMTCVAYALAYEAEYRRDIDYGIILHISFNPNYQYPIYQGSHLYPIDDRARSRFVLLREQKLDVLIQREDPGRQEDELRCRPCPFHSECWGGH